MWGLGKTKLSFEQCIGVNPGELGDGNEHSMAEEEHVQRQCHFFANEDHCFQDQSPRELL